jgi:CheY-like chemotaxis protein
VITDLHLPGMDGVQVTCRLQKRPDPPVVFVVTSDDSPEARARSCAAGADVFLLKAGNFAPRLLSAMKECFPDELDQSENKSAHPCESLLGKCRGDCPL